MPTKLGTLKRWVTVRMGKNGKKTITSAPTTLNQAEEWAAHTNEHFDDTIVCRYINGELIEE